MSRFAADTVPTQHQVGGTCYAHAAARIINRALRKLGGFRNEADNDGNKTANYIKIVHYITHEMTTKGGRRGGYGEVGASTKEVLECFFSDPTSPFIHKDLRLQVVESTLRAGETRLPKDVTDSLAQNFEVGCSFFLRESQWTEFNKVVSGSNAGDHLMKNGTFTPAFKSSPNGDLSGHAVTLRSFETKGGSDTVLHFENSWGSDGNFSLELPSVIGELTFFTIRCYIDVKIDIANPPPSLELYQRFIDNARNFDPRKMSILEPAKFNNTLKQTCDDVRLSPNPKQLGTGASATVYEGNYLGREVAIKKIDFKSSNKELGNIRKNCRDLWYSFDHQHIIQDFGFFVGDTIGFGISPVYFVMKKARYGSLQSIYVNRDTCDFYTTVSDLITALVYLEEQKIAHGDICPANILIDDNRGHKVALLTDFGSQLKIDETMRASKQQPMGHLGYYAPEIQKAFDRSEPLLCGVITCKSDIYSFGIVMVFILTGSPNISNINGIKDLTEDKKEIIELCLKEDPNVRFSASQLKQHILRKWPQKYPKSLALKSVDLALSASFSSTLLFQEPAAVTFMGHSDCVRSVAVLGNNGDRIVSGSDDNTVKIWNTSSGACLQTLTGHSGRVYSVAVLGNNGDRIVSGSADKTVKLWRSS